MSELCLTLLCPPTVEEKLLDLLLLSPQAAIFTSTATAVHDIRFNTLSPMEQVLGQAHATQIQVLCSAEDKAVLLEQVRTQFIGAGLRYWVTPLIEMGELA